MSLLFPRLITDLSASLCMSDTPVPSSSLWCFAGPAAVCACPCCWEPGAPGEAGAERGDHLFSELALLCLTQPKVPMAFFAVRVSHWCTFNSMFPRNLGAPAAKLLCVWSTLNSQELLTALHSFFTRFLLESLSSLSLFL